MLKKELLEAINVLILHSDFCDINIDDDRFDIKFSYYGKKDILDSAAEIDNKSKFHLIDSVDHIDFPQLMHKEKESDGSFIESKENNLPKEENPIIPSIAILNCANDDVDIWPRGKRPSSDIDGFKIALTRYIAENSGKDQNEIGKVFGITSSTVCMYIKKFNIHYNSKPGGWIIEQRKKKILKTSQKLEETIASQKTIIKHDQQNSTQDSKETNNGDMPNHLKKELYEMVRNAILNINMVPTEAIVLKSKFDSFGNNGNGNLITSNLGTWVLKSLNGSDSHLEFAGLATSAQYQLFPRWEIGKSYCILRFYGNIKTVEYVVGVHNGQMRVNRRP